MLVCTHNKVSYFSEDNQDRPRIIDTSSITQNEVRYGILIDDDHVVLGEADSNIHVVNLKEVKSVFSKDGFGIFKTFKVLRGSLYVLDSWHLRIFSLEDFSIRALKFWNTNSATAMDLCVRENQIICAFAQKTPKIIIYDITNETVITEWDISVECSAIIISQSYVVCSYGKSIKLWKWGTWEEVRRIISPDSPYRDSTINESETVIAGGCRNGNIHIWDVNDQNLLPLIFVGTSGAIQEIYFKDDFTLFCFSIIEDKLIVLNIPEFPKRYALKLTERVVKDMIYLEESNKILVNIKDQGLKVYDASNLDLMLDATEEKDLIISINDDQSKIFRVYNNEEGKSTANALLDVNTLEVIKEKTFSLNSSKWWISTHSARKKLPPRDQVIR